MVDDVLLPPWAQADAFEFVRLHREALESDYVSEVRMYCKSCEWHLIICQYWSLGGTLEVK